MFYRVAVLGLKIPLLTYFSPSEIKIGALVEVELKSKRCLGVIWEKEERPPEREIKEIKEVVNPEFFPIRLLRFYNFVSRYYFAYPGEVLSLAFPEIKRFDRRIWNQLREEVPKSKFLISRSGVYLFVGKKEEERMRMLLEKVRQRGGSILYLFPDSVRGERVFTQLREKWEGVIFYHSRIKKKERVRIWSEIKNGKYQIIIGLKQAIFLPIPNLREIWVEEEESPFYKEEERHFHYQARDCAVIRGKIENIPVYLFSQTPSLESYYYSQIKKYRFYGEFKKKEVKVIIVNLRKEKGILSDVLKKFLANYRQGETFYLLVERQGFSRYIICGDCGFIPRCAECGFPFFYHQKERVFSCHICKKKSEVFDECPNCYGVNFLFRGVGLERVEEELKVNFPQLRPVLAGGKGIFLGLSSELNNFLEGSVDLAAIISLEQLLSFPDFRTEERAYQILRSILGKLKRGGFLIIQTRNPSSPIISNLFRPIKFFAKVLKEREYFFLPPFSSIAILRIFRKEEVAMKKYEELKEKLAPFGEKVVLYPPFPSLKKKRGKRSFVILLKAKSGLRLYNLLKKEDLFSNHEEIEVDINPIKILT